MPKPRQYLCKTKICLNQQAQTSQLSENVYFIKSLTPRNQTTLITKFNTRRAFKNGRNIKRVRF